VTINFVILGFSNFNPQWFMWFMPLLSIILALYGGWWIMLLTTISFFGLTLLFDDKFLYWGILSPINSGLVNLPYMSDMIMNKGINTLTIVNFFRHILELITFYWLFQCAKFHK
jgi:hypothetical protein